MFTTKSMYKRFFFSVNKTSSGDLSLHTKLKTMLMCVTIKHNTLFSIKSLKTNIIYNI